MRLERGIAKWRVAGKNFGVEGMLQWYLKCSKKQGRRKQDEGKEGRAPQNETIVRGSSRDGNASGRRGDGCKQPAESIPAIYDPHSPLCFETDLFISSSFSLLSASCPFSRI